MNQDKQFGPIVDRLALMDRLLMRQATRFSFEKHGAASFEAQIEVELVQGDWYVRWTHLTLCRKQLITENVLLWGRTPYCNIEDVKFKDRDQAISVALDIAEGRVIPGSQNGI